MFVLIALMCMSGVYLLMVRVGKTVPGAQMGLENPLFVPILWVLFQMTDFIYLYYDNSPSLRGVYFTGENRDIVYGLLVFTLAIIALLSGIGYGLSVFSKNSKEIVNRAIFTRDAAKIALPFSLTIVSLNIFLFIQLIVSNSENFSEISALKAKTASDFPILSVLTWMSVLSVGYLVSTSTRSKTVLLAYLIPAMALSWGTGSRIHLIILAIFALQAFRRRNVSIPVGWAPIIAPLAIIFLTLLRSVRAGSGGITNFFYDRGGVLPSLYGSDEVATAETITFGLKNLSQAFMYRWPGEGIAGLLITYLPREYIQWKPFPASSQFTQWLSPGIWEASRSQFTIGGVMEACMEFGVVGALLYLFVIGFGFAYLLCRAARSPSLQAFFYASLSIFLFLVLRTDMQTSGVFVLPLILTVSAIALLRQTTRKTRRARIHPGRFQAANPQYLPNGARQR
ncbi:hypothetical protein [Novosphingobium sp. Chol11]|uniref:hypothetical protein n=1 Tax=Novosphingobium sp. Chol11 TaxID=1385763 RepID=UPI0025CDAD55|nr:hypothetical protein [Novosphingobium sp. Chol11]